MAAITVAKKGMLVAKDIRLLSEDGSIIAQGGIQRLCRCGRSSTKPFCDDTHRTFDFDDDKKEGRVPEKVDVYEGKEATILDDRGACSHAGFCTDLLPTVWKSGQEPWIDADGGPVGDIIDVIRRCPSGALAYRLADGEVQDAFHDEPEIIVAKAGPLRVRGGPGLKDPDGNRPRSLEHYALCRCGHSKNKPFCDGTHWYVNFGHQGPETDARTETAGYVDIGAPEDFEEGRPAAVDADGTPLAAFRLWGRVCAVAAEHDGFDMTSTTLDGGRIVGAEQTTYTPYPWARGPEDDLPVHDVMVVQGRVWVSREPEP